VHSVYQRAGIPLLALIILSVGAPVSAQDQADVQGAARAFSEGQNAQLRGENARAAEFFELADRLAPSAAALRSAIRTRRAAGQHAEAATLALRAFERYASDAEVRRVAEEAMGEAPRLARLRISCTGGPCGLTIDGRALVMAAVERLEVFVNPGPHVLRATWEAGGETQQNVDAQVGGDVSLELAPPPRSTDPDPDPDTDTVADPVTEPDTVRLPDPIPTPDPAPTPAEPRGLSPWLFWSALVATVVVSGIAVWSGLDTLDANEDYEAMPTFERYEAGVDLELRTNILIAGASVLAIGTAVLAVLTDWSGDPVSTEERPLSAGAFITPHAAGFQLRGGF
jgi:hypothetical protein